MAINEEPSQANGIDAKCLVSGKRKRIHFNLNLKFQRNYCRAEKRGEKEIEN